ncbi:MAG: hypothetical protein J6S53_02385 [Lentisphaeria bacterium]|nr:hypothetical protein [Lentisphaeria bacterium]
MKHFLCKFLIYTGLLCSISVLLFLVWFFLFIYGKMKNNYDSAIEIKMERLLNTPSPKIILAGNSNLPFGIDSSMLERKLGMPCVNLGLNGGMGNAFYEKMASMNIGKGDLVIILYTHYEEEINGPFFWGFYFSTKMFRNPLFSPSLLLKQLYALPAFMKYMVMETLQKKFSGNKAGKFEHIYKSSSFNIYGDIAVERPAAFSADIPSYIPIIQVATVKRLNKWHEEIQQKGAFLLAASYPVYAGKNVADKEKMLVFQKKLQKELSFPVISDFREYYFPPEYFFDSCFHLTKEGAEKRTALLVKDIENWQKKYGK